MALKGEAMGLAMMLEIPLLIVDVQRGGPSTGLPTKTEQSDLLQAYYGRNGESPMPVVSASTPSDCFEAVYEAVRISVEHMTPVIFLSDGYIANGAEPWQFPNTENLPAIHVNFKTELGHNEPSSSLTYAMKNSCVPGPCPAHRDWSTALAAWRKKTLPAT
jgi:2-oxoglutarate ferredoxin oxidoreductase subunit alpha